MINRRGQIFSLFMVFFTLFLCGTVIALYFIQQGAVHASLVSPTGVLLVRDNLTIFEMREVELIKKSLPSEDFGSEDFKASFRNNFIEGVLADENMKSFLFSNLYINGVEVREQDKNRNLLEDGIYPENSISFDGDKMNFGRTKIRKEVLLIAEDRSKIDFPIYFTFEFDRKYLINKNGEVTKL